jgi:hypothetical protein
MSRPRAADRRSCLRKQRKRDTAGHPTRAGKPLRVRSLHPLHQTLSGASHLLAKLVAWNAPWSPLSLACTSHEVSCEGAEMPASVEPRVTSRRGVSRDTSQATSCERARDGRHRGAHSGELVRNAGWDPRDRARRVAARRRQGSPGAAAIRLGAPPLGRKLPDHLHRLRHERVELGTGAAFQGR